MDDDGDPWGNVDVELPGFWGWVLLFAAAGVFGLQNLWKRIHNNTTELR